MMSIYNEIHTVTTVGGTATVTTKDIHGYIGFIGIKPTTTTETFTVVLNDEHGFKLWDRTVMGEIGEPREMLVNGVYTFTITTTATDFDFGVKISVRE